MLVESGEFERAVLAIERALMDPNLTGPVASQLYELQANAWLYLGKEDKARLSLEQLLRLSPDYQLAKGTSPKLRSTFEGLRAAPRPVEKVGVESFGVFGGAEVGRPVELRAELKNLPQGAQPKVYWRKRGAGKYGSSGMTTEDRSRFAAQIPAFELPAGENGVLEYYLEVADLAGRRLASSGSAERPLALEIAGPAGTSGPALEDGDPWYTKWWVWAIAGGLAAGAGAAVAYPLIKGQRAEVPITVTVQQ